MRYMIHMVTSPVSLERKSGKSFPFSKASRNSNCKRRKSNFYSILHTFDVFIDLYKVTQ